MLTSHTLISITVSALAWIVFWCIDQQLSFLQYSTGISLVFLPAGIRTLAVFLFGFPGAVGILLGTLVTAAHYFSDQRAMSLFGMIAVSMISAFSAYIVMGLVCYWRGIARDLSSITFRDVLTIVITQGMLSAALHKSIFYVENIDSLQQAEHGLIFMNWLAMSLGDIMGSMIVLTGLWAVFSRVRLKGLT